MKPDLRLSKQCTKMLLPIFLLAPVACEKVDIELQSQAEVVQDTATPSPTEAIPVGQAPTDEIPSPMPSLPVAKAEESLYTETRAAPCGVSIPIPKDSFTKTKIYNPVESKEVENVYRWVVDEVPEINRVDVVWRAVGGFDPSSGEGPRAIITIKCIQDVPSDDLEAFKDHLVRNSEYVDFVAVVKNLKWGLEVYKISYRLTDPTLADSHILDDYFLGTEDTWFVFVHNDLGYIVDKDEFVGYWPDETVVESNVEDLDAELKTIFEGLNFHTPR